MPLRLILFGRQGAGKGTQCDALVARYGTVHISTGDILREAVAEGTDLGVKAKGFMDVGELLPDELIVGIVEERLAKPDVGDRGFILDGFPRTLPQAEALWSACGPDGIDLAVDLDVPLDVVKERMLGRGREDDNEEAIGRRLELYEQETVPAILFFSARDKLAVVDGVGTPDEVSSRLFDAIDRHADHVAAG